MKKANNTRNIALALVILVALSFAFSQKEGVTEMIKGESKGGFNVTLPPNFVFAQGAIWENIRLQEHINSPNKGKLYNTPDFLIVDQPLYDRSLMQYVKERHGEFSIDDQGQPIKQISEVKVGRRHFIRVQTDKGELGYYTKKHGWAAGIVDPMTTDLENEEAMLREIVKTLK